MALHVTDKNAKAMLGEVFSEKSIINNVQQALPEKVGQSKTTKKLVIKSGDDFFDIIQKTNIGYVRYVLSTNNGDASSASTGVNWDLIRLKRVKSMSDCLVWYEPTISTGALTTSIAPAVFSTVDNKFVLKSDNTYMTNYAGIYGLGLYDVAANTSVTFDFKKCQNSKVKLTYLTQSNRSDNVEIQINGVKIVQFTCKRGVDGIYNTIEFDVPNELNNTTTFQLTIKNNSATEKFSYVAFNLSHLEDYNDSTINYYKVFGNSKEWINNSGASDYAIEDLETGKWLGSYHGGETREYGKITFSQLNFTNNESNLSMYDITTIPVGNWCVLDDVRLIQKTNLNNKAKMTSLYDFNVDGTMTMNFGLNESTIKAKNFYTALTCAKQTFEHVYTPFFMPINLNNDTDIPLNYGYIEQYDAINLTTLGIRFTMFDNKYNARKSYIRNNSNYSKFYYGIIVDNQDGIQLPSLTFSKSLDFYNHTL